MIGKASSVNIIIIDYGWYLCKWYVSSKSISSKSFSWFL